MIVGIDRLQKLVYFSIFMRVFAGYHDFIIHSQTPLLFLHYLLYGPQAALLTRREVNGLMD